MLKIEKILFRLELQEKDLHPFFLEKYNEFKKKRPSLTEDEVTKQDDALVEAFYICHELDEIENNQVQGIAAENEELRKKLREIEKQERQAREEKERQLQEAQAKLEEMERQRQEAIEEAKRQKDAEEQARLEAEQKAEEEKRKQLERLSQLRPEQVEAINATFATLKQAENDFKASRQKYVRESIEYLDKNGYEQVSKKQLQQWGLYEFLISELNGKKLLSYGNVGIKKVSEDLFEVVAAGDGQ